MNKNKSLFFVTLVMSALCIISGSIALPIFIRPFYYAHIKPFNLEQISGKTYEQIVDAYNKMLNYCMGLTNEFSLGEFEFTPDGAAHFLDVRKLFILDILVFVITAIFLCLLFIMCKRKKVNLYEPLGYSPWFFAALFILVNFVTIAMLVSINFNAAFKIFHKMFFAGKTNWSFNIYTDPIILVLPEEFFRNCAILIFSVLIILCISIIVLDIKRHKKTA